MRLRSRSDTGDQSRVSPCAHPGVSGTPAPKLTQEAQLCVVHHEVHAVHLQGLGILRTGGPGKAAIRMAWASCQPPAPTCCSASSQMPAGAQTTLESVLPLAAALGLLTSASTRPNLYNMAPAPDHPRFIQGRVIKSPVCRVPSRLGRPVWRHGCADGQPCRPC